MSLPNPLDVLTDIIQKIIDFGEENYVLIVCVVGGLAIMGVLLTIKSMILGIQ